MLIKCECGITYNNETINQCPVCNYHPEKRDSKIIDVMIKELKKCVSLSRKGKFHKQAFGFHIKYDKHFQKPLPKIYDKYFHKSLPKTSLFSQDQQLTNYYNDSGLCSSSHDGYNSWFHDSFMLLSTSSKMKCKVCGEEFVPENDEQTMCQECEKDTYLDELIDEETR